MLILLDIDQLLVKPCFPLFPEWGTRLFVVGSNDSIQNWETIDYLLSMEPRTEIWLLSNAPDSNLETMLESTTDSRIKAVLQKIDNKIQQSTVAFSHLIYRYSGDEIDPLLPTIAGHQKYIVTEFSRPLPPDNEQLSKQWLLPMGIRALLNSDTLLERTANPVQIIVRGDGQRLTAAIEQHKQQVARFSKSLQAKTQQLDEAIPQLTINQLSSDQVITEFNYRAEPTDNRFGYYYRAEDEDLIKQWINEYTDKLLQQLKSYNRTCHQQYLQVISNLHDPENSLLSSITVQQSAITTERITHHNILQGLAQQSQTIISETTASNLKVSPQDNQQQLADIERQQRQDKSEIERPLLAACRLRPSLKVLLCLLFIPSVLLTAMLFTGRIIPPAQQLPLIPLLFFALILFTFWAIIIIVKLYLVHRRFKQAIAAAQRGLKREAEKIERHARQIRATALNFIKHAILEDNINSIKKDEQRFLQNKSKIQYHKNFANQCYSNNQPCDESVPAADSINQASEQQPAYYWTGEVAEFFDGNALIEAGNNSDEQHRYSGAVKITFLGP